MSLSEPRLVVAEKVLVPQESEHLFVYDFANDGQKADWSIVVWERPFSVFVERGDHCCLPLFREAVRIN